MRKFFGSAKSATFNVAMGFFVPGFGYLKRIEFAKRKKTFVQTSEVSRRAKKYSIPTFQQNLFLFLVLKSVFLFFTFIWSKTKILLVSTCAMCRLSPRFFLPSFQSCLHRSLEMEIESNFRSHKSPTNELRTEKKTNFLAPRWSRLSWLLILHNGIESMKSPSKLEKWLQKIHKMKLLCLCLTKLRRINFVTVQKWFHVWWTACGKLKIHARANWASRKYVELQFSFVFRVWVYAPAIIFECHSFYTDQEEIVLLNGITNSSHLMNENANSFIIFIIATKCCYLPLPAIEIVYIFHPKEPAAHRRRHWNMGI